MPTRPSTMIQPKRKNRVVPSLNMMASMNASDMIDSAEMARRPQTMNIGSGHRVAFFTRIVISM